MRSMSRARRERLLRALEALRETFELDGVTYTFDPRHAAKSPTAQRAEIGNDL